MVLVFIATHSRKFGYGEKSGSLFKFPEIGRGVVKHIAEVGTEVVTLYVRSLGIHRFQGHVAEIGAAMRGNSIVQNVTGICRYNVNLLFGNVGVDVADIQQIVGIMLLLWHTEYSPDGLNSEPVALEFTEDKQNGSARTVPAKGDSLLEQ